MSGAFRQKIHIGITKTNPISNDSLSTPLRLLTHPLVLTFQLLRLFPSIRDAFRFRAGTLDLFL
jgi:hypothetical protein